MVGAAGGSSETDLLKRTQAECLTCAGTGRAPGGTGTAAQAGE
jgi:hypothetical protein